MENVTKCLALLGIFLAEINGFSIWDPIVDIPGLYSEYNGDCIRTSPGTYQHCYNYNGTVGCMQEADLGGGIWMGYCLCNLGDDAYFEEDETIVDAPRCLGKVGALCTAEHSTMVPDKLCTPFADCIPDGPGFSTGTCQCRQGYEEDTAGANGKCIPNGDTIGTPRTTTTPRPSDAGSIKLPPLGVMFSFTAGFNKFCGFEGQLLSLNRSYCDHHSRTVSCNREPDKKRCECNMRDDSEWDPQLNMCVGLAGTYCLARGNILGYKVCTKGADCLVEEGTFFDDGYSFGTCECLYGWDEQDDGTCKRDLTITNPSTPRNIVPSQAMETSGEPTTTKPTTTTPAGATGLSPVMTHVILGASVLLCYLMFNQE